MNAIDHFKLRSLLNFKIQIFSLYKSCLTSFSGDVAQNSRVDAAPELAPRLLVAFGEDRSRYESAQEILRYAGIAPVKEKSGKKEWIHWRWSCPKFLRQTFVEWANQTRHSSFWASAFYEQQKRAGKTHQTAIRALAFKWIRILFRCWKDRVPYDEVKYLMALKRKGSPLVKNLTV